MEKDLKQYRVDVKPSGPNILHPQCPKINDELACAELNVDTAMPENKKAVVDPYRFCEEKDCEHNLLDMRKKTEDYLKQYVIATVS